MTGGGVTKRVPIVVVGVKPNAADVASLQTIATNSGGVYRSAMTAFEVNAAVDYAVQLGSRDRPNSMPVPPASSCRSVRSWEPSI